MVTFIYVAFDPWVPVGGRYSLGKAIFWRLLIAYFRTPVFFTVFSLLQPLLQLSLITFVKKQLNNNNPNSPKENYLRIQSKALWNSCSAKSYSDTRMLACSKVTDIPVLSLALLQLVNLRPEMFGNENVCSDHITINWCQKYVNKIEYLSVFDIFELIDEGFERFYFAWYELLFLGSLSFPTG